MGDRRGTTTRWWAGDADGETPTDRRPCDRCPRASVTVVRYTGDDVALCAQCRQRILLGR